MSSLILSMKVLLISAGVVSLAVGLRFSVPIAVSEIPAMWSIIMSWLKPPYLYLIINGIIITIAASSRFHQSQTEEPTAARSEQLTSVSTPTPASFETFSDHQDISTVLEAAAAAEVVSEIEDAIVELKPVTVNGLKVDIKPDEETVAEAQDRDVFVESTFKYNTLPAQKEIISPERQLEALFPVREKPLVTSRFGHRKPNRTSPEGVRSLRVARVKKHETLDSTWRMITDGRRVPLTRHFRKCETWEHGHVSPAVDRVPKSETFKDRGAPRIGKEPSLSHEELNRRVEAFIKKINEEMRMQRQESLNQYMEMINRGV
ncbi:hypothetical protein OROGR_003185 [Orobanche gracilis]